MRPSSAASVVAQSRRTAVRSSSGGGGGPRRREEEDFCLDADVEDPLLLWGSSFLPGLLSGREGSDGFDDADPSGLMDGRMSFFCFEAGRISSRSTGTPRETRKSRRIRDLTQFGGCSGGGATS